MRNTRQKRQYRESGFVPTENYSHSFT